MAYKLIHFLLLLSFSFTSWINNPLPILTQSFDAKSAAMGGINSFKNSDESSVQFSYSSSKENIFEESSIIFSKNSRSYYFYYFGVSDLDNTIGAWNDDGDGIPYAHEIDYTHITSFDYKLTSFTYPVKLSTLNLELWPTFSYSSLYEESSYSAGCSISNRLNYKHVQFLLFVHDALSSKWWSTNRKEKYLPFLELIINVTHDKTMLLFDGILNAGGISGSIGLDLYLHENLSLRGGYKISGLSSIGLGIRMNFIDLDIALLSSNIEHPFQPSQQFTLKLFVDKALSETKKLSP